MSNFDPFSLGTIYTTEPMAMRALAGELRANPDVARNFFMELFGAKLSDLSRVACEVSTHERLDVLLTFGNVTVGIEGKIGHAVTIGQLEAEASAVDHLVVLVKEVRDVPTLPDVLHQKVRVAEWETILGRLPHSRLTSADIHSVEDSNRIARRALAEVVVENLPTGWDFEREASDSGYPSLVVTSDYLEDDRWLVIQIETDRAAPGQRYLGNVGIRVIPSDFDCETSGATEPTWITYARQIGQFLEPRLAGTAAEISSQAGRGISGTRSGVKIEQAALAELPMNYAVGYTNSYLGVRTVKVATGDLDAMASALIPAVVELSRLLEDGER